MEARSPYMRSILMLIPHAHPIFSLPSLPGSGIRAVFERARREAPCLLVLEDLDSLITDRNRSFFLNELDGLEGNDGLFLIGSTNHPERLDGSLSNRPSRFDRK
jgi:transitional endoplasmic reticulum ATPase